MRNKYFIPLAVAAVIFLGPLFSLLGQIDVASLRELLGGASFSRSLWVTLVSAIGGSLLSIALALAFARQFALHAWRGRRLQRLGLLMPYLVPNFILASAYVLAWNPTTGLLNRLLYFPGGLYGLSGLTWLFAVAHMPVAFLLLEDKFKRIEGSLREAAQLAGASSRQILAKIELPLLAPTLGSAFALCFTLNLSAFAIPAWIGAPERRYTLTYKIYQVLQIGGDDALSQAAALSLLLFALAVPALLAGSMAARREKLVVLVSGKAARPARAEQSRPSFAVFQALYVAFLGIAWALPLGALALSTLVKPGCLQSNGLSCLAETSLRSYRYVLFDLSETRLAFRSSLLYGGLSAILILVVAVFALIAFAKAPRTRQIAEWIFAVPLATPGAILALGLIVCASGRYGVNLYDTPYIAVAAYVLKHFNLAYQPLRSGYSSLSVSLTEAAQLAGAGTGARWRRITLPMLRPELVGGFFLVLIPILGELTMSVFLASPSFRSIGTVLFDLQDYADQSSAAALSVLLVILVLGLNETAHWLSGGQLGY